MTGQLALFAAFGLLVACQDEQLNPVSSPDGTVTTPPTEATELPPTNPPKDKKRDVFQRNPFGNVAETQNLLWDGDFEWSSPFTDQYGWIELPSSPTLADIVVGPACKSGLKCARVGKNTEVIGIAVSSATLGLEASIWARFEPADGQPPPDCTQVIAFLLDLSGLPPFDADAALVPVSTAPDESGWCRLTASTPVRNNKTYLYVENDGAAPILLDDCVIKATGTMAFAQAPHVSLDAAARERAEAAVRRARFPIDGAPNRAKDALESHKRR